jgi:hypothetical protein
MHFKIGDTVRWRCDIKGTVKAVSEDAIQVVWDHTSYIYRVPFHDLKQVSKEEYTIRRDLHRRDLVWWVEGDCIQDWGIVSWISDFSIEIRWDKSSSVIHPLTESRVIRNCKHVL